MKKPTASKIRTKVKSINWAFTDSDTTTLAHGIHRYSGKYIPQIASAAIDILSEPNELILDPYVGSGTTLIEANQLERKSIGLDLNPLAVLLTNTKVNPIDEDQARNLIEYFEGIISKHQSSNTIDMFNQDKIDASNGILESSKYLKDEWYLKWFSLENLKKLITLKQAIDDYPDKKAANVALVAFSNILRRASNAHSGFPNVMFDKNRVANNSIYKIYMKELTSTCSRITLQEKVWNQIDTQVIEGDARSIPLKDNSIDAIITHPPYIGSVPYAEYGLLSLKWLGHDPKEIDKKLTGGGRQKSDVIERFKAGYSDMIHESFRVLKPGRHMFILIGHPTVKGKLYDLGDMTLEFATQAGFKLVVREYRNGSNRRANKMGHEDLIFLEKPVL